MMKVYQKRRQILGKLLPENCAIIIPGADLKYRNSDSSYNFRQDSNFYYLSGFSEASSAMLIVNTNGKISSSIFVPKKDKLKEIWDGHREGPEGAKQTYLFDNSFNNDEIDIELPKLIQGMDKVFYPFGKKDGFDQLIINWMKTVSTIKGRHNKSIDIADGSSLIGNLRLIKDSNEIEILKQACEISANAHIQAMKTVKAGMNEQFIEALYLYEFAKQGGRFPAYTPIVAGGDNACVLHYVDNNKELNNSDLLLVDAGCEYEMYASDITRTFPVSGKFSSEQLAIYNIVLDALHQATACVKVGNNVMDPQIITEKVITKGLIELGILKGDADKLYKDGAYKDFYMHKFGHWMGLDVHDAGDYMENDDFMSFKAGMVTTVEPGIYISKDADVEDKWKGIGIRIEDDILVTESGNINLTEKVPSDPKEIEALMA
jgi:Xaa-Pro aminopeptidase